MAPKHAITLRPSFSLPIRWKCVHKNVIFDVLCARPNWEHCSSDPDDYTDCDFAWVDTSFIRNQFDALASSRSFYCNHFRNYYELTRKDLLIKNLKRMIKACEKSSAAEALSYQFFPPTFVLPTEYALFLECFRQSQGVWIMKPCGMAQGKGIFLISTPKQVLEWKRTLTSESEKNAYIVQKYIENPLLIGGRKFDLRIYVLVTSYAPLNVFLYREGFARFSSSQFSMSSEDISNHYVHLTNVAIQKTLKKMARPIHLFTRSSGLCNHFFSTFLRAMENTQITVFKQYNKLLTIIQDAFCYELYGYDVLIDDTLTPWLIEVNASPSLSASDDDDYQLKKRLLDDVINVLDPENRFPPQSVRVGGFQQLVQGGIVYGDIILGASNKDRDEQLRRLLEK
ncbi:hypothetical protein GEMRC1_006758 [Eukaryota sp. GEM-RC1]